MIEREAKSPRHSRERQENGSQMPSTSGMLISFSISSKVLSLIRSSGSQPNLSTGATDVVSDATHASPATSLRLNNDKAICYAFVEYRRHCVLCGVSNSQSMVNHYVKFHPNDEVFISRVTQAYAEQAMSGPPAPGLQVKNKLTAVCYFCQTEMIKQVSYWGDHIRGHTGERNYKCEKHGLVENYHACKSKVKVLRYSFSNNLLSGFICKECNYVQVQEKNIIQHIKKQHGQQEHFDKFYQEIHFVSKEMRPRSEKCSYSLFFEVRICK